MPELPRELPHLYLRNSGLPEPYTSKSLARDKKLPERDRLAHADRLGGRALGRSRTQNGVDRNASRSYFPSLHGRVMEPI